MLVACLHDTVNELLTEKEIATQLEELGREVKRLHKEIRGAAIPVRGHSSRSHPPFPTESERRLRPLDDNHDSRKSPC